MHAPPGVAPVFDASPVRTDWTAALNLDTEIRFHLAPRLHEFVELLLGEGPHDAAASLADEMFRGGLRFYLTRDLEAAHSQRPRAILQRAQSALRPAGFLEEQ